MSDRLSRSEVKRDELTEGLEASIEYARRNVRRVLTIISVVIVVGAAFLAWRAWGAKSGAGANAALDAAIRVYGAPIQADAKPDDPNQPSFATEEARRAKARQLFESLASRHASTPAGNTAWVYLGRLALERGEADAAAKAWRDYLAHEDEGMLAAAVTLDLVRLDRSQGRGEQAAKDLEALLAKPTKPVPDDALLYELGVTLKGLGRNEDARRNLQRILDEFPRSSYRGAAQQELSAVGAA
jgi:tetratricopeptide (TPR) repeat protein